MDLHRRFLPCLAVALFVVPLRADEPRPQESPGETAEPAAPAAPSDPSDPGDPGDPGDPELMDDRLDPGLIPDERVDDVPPLLGEYVGEVGQGDDRRVLALQLRPIGGGDFDAIAYTGGLPGTEDHDGDGDVVRYVGRRSGDVTVMAGGPYAMFATRESCTLIRDDGTRLGVLKRVERTSPTMGATPPEGAEVILPSDADAPRGVTLSPLAVDFDLHVEFKLPLESEDRGESRGNSGVYLQGRYECQILDSFAKDVDISGCGAIYKYRLPKINATLPPGVWQTYDIRFTAPRFNADGSKRRDATITSYVNGVLVQDAVAVTRPTGRGKPESPTPLPTVLQDHDDDVRFRNVWMVDRGLTEAPFPPPAG